MAVVTRLSDVFTNPEGLPTILHGTGVPGASARWLAVDAEVSVNNPFQSLKSHPEGQTVGWIAPNTLWPVLKDVSGIKVAEFDGVNDALGLVGSPLVPYRSVAAVVRRTAVTSAYGYALGAGASKTMGLGVTPANQFLANWIGSTSSTGVAWADLLWHFVAWSGSATDQVACFDGNNYSNTGDVATACNDIYMGRVGWTAVYGAFQIAEVIAWPDALTTGDFATVRTAMKDRYTAALAL